MSVTFKLDTDKGTSHGTNRMVSKAKAADKPYKLADGDGMYLLVHPNGRKYWRMDFHSL